MDGNKGFQFFGKIKKNIIFIYTGKNDYPYLKRETKYENKKISKTTDYTL
jgi:hypothetical protein